MRAYRGLALLIPIVVLTLAACQGSGSSGSSNPGSAASGNKEQRAVRAARVPLDKAAEVANRDDWPTARTAFFDYTEAWNGLEQYVRVRSLGLYHEIEDPFPDITKLLETPTPSKAAVSTALKAQQDSYAKAIALADAGPALPPVVDHVSDLRILRLQLRTTQRALRANDVRTAQDAYRKFEAGWDSVEDYIREKSSTNYRDIETAMGEVNATLLRPSRPNVAQVTPAFDTLLSRYNEGVASVSADLPTPGAFGGTAPQLDRA